MPRGSPEEKTSGADRQDGGRMVQKASGGVHPRRDQPGGSLFSSTRGSHPMQLLPMYFFARRGRLYAVALLACLLAVPVAQAQKSRHGGIEIGAKGVKAAALEVTPGKEGLNTKQLFSKTANTTLSALKDGKFREDAIEETGE